MGRPQAFDRTQVLDNAMNVFWQKGYAGASIQDLVDATGLNRGSLYNSFGDKAELFAEVMNVYRRHSPSHILSSASPDDDVYVLFQDFFEALIVRFENDRDHKGCLLTNTAAGFYGCSEQMTDWVCQSLAELEALFAKLIGRGQKRGDIQCQDDPLKIARFLLSAAQGLNVMARTEACAEALRDIAEQTLKSLKHP